MPCSIAPAAGAQVALAVADIFARQTRLESLQAQNISAPLAGEEAQTFKSLLAASSYIAAFTFAAWLGTTLSTAGEAADEAGEPSWLFETPQDALKSMVAGLDRTIAGSPDDLALVSRSRAFARVAIEGLVARKARFEGLASFENSHIRVEQDDFELNALMSHPAPGKSRWS